MLIVRSGGVAGARAAIALMLAALAVALVVGGAFASGASAQVPAICDQYPELPQCSPADNDPDGDDPDGTDDGDTGVPAGTDDAGGPSSAIPGGGGGPTAGAGATGELPFTGYPLTPLLLLLLALLLAGLLLRAYLALRDRFATRARPGDGTLA